MYPESKPMKTREVCCLAVVIVFIIVGVFTGAVHLRKERQQILQEKIKQAEADTVVVIAQIKEVKNVSHINENTISINLVLTEVFDNEVKEVLWTLNGNSSNRNIDFTVGQSYEFKSLHGVLINYKKMES